ncbi:hypothetical protein AQUCO_03400232v1 [Aquilegia coerulea]|uniref:Pentacotripeptide-repeat region of PRORP domain-containing protein n=1 Tax=Aquilegia coerulea TaxID=218851 RepID=A0A2G5CY25_AQUCA|nr:hypothetical protein AQUCO_03400232v1 [Aquilegia coerulea]
MPVRDAMSYNFLIYCFGSNGFYGEVLNVVCSMLDLGLFPNFGSILYAIMACGEMRSLESGILIHNYLIQNGFGLNVRIANSLISMYTKLGRLDLGYQVFNDMPERDVVSWNSMITGFAQNGKGDEAFDLYLSMKNVEDLVPSRVTFLGLLLACGQVQNLNMGKIVHGHLIHPGLMSDFRLGTSVLDMYLKCGEVECARIIFEEELLEKNLVSWNSLLAGYSQNGCDWEAVFLFQRLLSESNLKPDSITIANVVPACARLANLQMIRLIHTLIIKKGLQLVSDIVLGTSMVDAYGKCFDIKASTFLFTCSRKQNAAIWNAMISGYNLNHSAYQGIELFTEMLRYEVLPDTITMVMLLQSCGELGSLKQGSIIHGYCFSKGFNWHLTVSNAMMDMYIKCGCIRSSLILFNSMCYKNIVTWNTLLCGYVRIGRSAMAIDLFNQLQWETQHRPDPVTMITVTQASSTGSANHGVANSLIDAYAKNGLIHSAWSLFEQMGKSKDNSSWNVMLAGLGMNGYGRKACALLSQMEEDGYEPNSITFVSLLSSCSHSGLIDEGCYYFNLMVTKYNIQPCLEHWTCVIDMFGRAGRLEEAYHMIQNGLPQGGDPGNLSNCAAVWGALLSACRMHVNVELGELASQQLSRLSPDNCGYYTLLSNLYSSGRRWNEAANMRRVFEDGKLMKKPGFSTVNV